MDHNTSGSFGSVLGGGSAIYRALARRQSGEPTSTLSQVSPSVSTGQEALPPAPPTNIAIPTGMSQSPQGASMPSGMPVGSGEADLIIKALSKRLESLSKVEQANIQPTM